MAHNAKLGTDIMSVEDPYAVLNLPRNAKKEDIQRAYKLLSRAFHPDKQHPTEKVNAQVSFLALKESYDILSDPALRLAFDEHGLEGLQLLKESPTLYKEILFLLESHQRIQETSNVESLRTSFFRDALMRLSDAKQSHQFQALNDCRPNITGIVKLHCDATNTVFPHDPLALEVEETSFNVAIDRLPTRNDKWGFRLSGNGGLSRAGEGQSTGEVSLKYEVSQGTNVNVDVEFGENGKVALETSRMMSKGTLITSSLSSLPQSNDLMFSLTSHRSLFKNTVNGTWLMGMSCSNLNIVYGLFSMTTTFENQPQCTLKLNFGVNNTPMKIMVTDKISDKHKYECSWSWGGRGSNIEAILKRTVSSYCQLSLGIKVVASKGLVWLFRLNHGNMNISIPVLITSNTSPGYAIKTIYTGLITGLVDASIGEYLRYCEDVGQKKRRGMLSLATEERLMEREKAKKDALVQIALMTKPAEAKRRKEEISKSGGLVVLWACYSVKGGDSIDVTIALQFWVANSSLILPPTTKASMMGFYDVRKEAPTLARQGFLNSFVTFLQSTFKGKSYREKTEKRAHEEIPSLRVRYRFQGYLYETEVLDDQPLILPSDSALKIGDKFVD